MSADQIYGSLLTILVSLVTLVTGHFFKVIVGAMEARRSEELSERQKLADERALMRKSLKLIMRGTLVQLHGQFVAYGDCDDTQRRTWEGLYELYEELCTLTGDPNGVIAKYHDDVMNLPERGMR